MVRGASAGDITIAIQALDAASAQVNRVAASIGTLDRSVGVAQAQMAGYGHQLSFVTTGTNRFVTGQELLATTFQRQGRQITQTRNALGRFAGSQQVAAGASRDFGRQLTLFPGPAFAGTQTKMATASVAAASAAASAGVAVETMGKKTTKATSELHRMSSVIRGMVIRMAAFAAGAYIVGVVTRGVIGAAIDFENSFAGIRKTMDLTEAEFRRLERANRDLALSIPLSVNALNQIGKIAGELNITGVANIVKFEETVARMSVSTNLSVEDSATALGRLTVVTQTPIQNVDRLASAIVGLGNQFAGTESEIATFAVRIAGAGHAVGLTVPGILAIAAAFTHVGVPAERGGTAVQRVLFAMQSAAVQGGEALETFTTILGVTAEEFRRMATEDPGAALLLFIQRLGQAGPTAVAALDALGLADARLISSFLSTASAQGEFNRAMEEANRLYGSNLALMTESNRRFKTTSSQAQLMRNRFNELGIAMGQTLLPALVGLSHVAGALAAALQGLRKHLDLVALGLIMVGSALTGPLAPITALIGAVTFLGFRWEQVFRQLPGPVQDAAIAVANIFDAIANAMVSLLENLAKAINQFINKVNVVAKPLGRILGMLTGGRIRFEGFPTIPEKISIGKIDVSGALEEARRGLSPMELFRKVERELMREREQGRGFRDFLDLEDLDFSGLGDAADAAGAAAKEIDLLADGIIDLSEALEHGIDIQTAVTMELGKHAEEMANRFWRAAVEMEKARRLMEPGAIAAEAMLRLQEQEVAFAQSIVDLEVNLAALDVLLGQQRLTGQAIVFRNALVSLGGGFRQAGESVVGFLTRLASASLRAVQERFDQLFARPSREEARTQLQLAELRRNRLLRIQAGATEEQIAAMDDEIEAIQSLLDLRRAEIDIMQAQSVLADQTLLTGHEQMTQARLLIGYIASQSALVDDLNTKLDLETLATIGATDALKAFTQALIAARDVIGGGGRAGGVGVQTYVTVNAADRGAIVREAARVTARETEKALVLASLGGSFVTTGAFVPG